MNKLETYFFRNSLIYFNDQEIKLPYIKVEGVLYYLIVKNIAGKDELCNLLWPDFSEQLAQKNLRNAIYVLRKIFGEKFLLNPKRNIIQLTAELELITDLDYLTKDYYPQNETEIAEFVDFYQQDFLGHFNINASDVFYDWVTVNQENYKKIYLEKLIQAADKAKQLGLDNLYEKCLLKCINLEPYEENYYFKLMIFWSELDRNKECFELFNKLKKILKDDLCIEPQKRIADLIENLFPKKFVSRKEFYGRNPERQSLRQNFDQFINNQDFSSCLILGEPGIGKSKLIYDFMENIDQEQCIKLDITCYRVDKEFSFKLWDSILDELSSAIISKDISLPLSLVNNIISIFPSFEITADNIIGDDNPHKYFQTEIMIIQLMELISKKQKVVLVIDNMHWVDEDSIELLEAVLIKCRKNLFLVATSRDIEDEYVDRFLLDLFNSGLIKKLPLSRFSLAETKEMIELLDENAADQYKLIYKESEGNPFFITEILNNYHAGMNIHFMNQKMSELIGSRLMILSDNAKGILNICAIFQSDFTFNMIARISGLNNILLTDILDELLSKKFICVFKNSKNEELFYLSHQKIKEYIYYHLLQSKRKVLHRRVAEYYESNLKDNQNDRFYYLKLIYHYKKAEDELKTLKYRIKYLELVLRFQHELFPTFEKIDGNNASSKFYKMESVEKEFNEILKALNSLKGVKDTEEFIELEIIYLHLRGRFYESTGEIRKSIKLLENMVDLATKWHKGRYIYEGYLQMILHGIDIYDLEYVKKIIAKAKKVDYIKNNPICYANIMRHEGYNRMHKGDFAGGEKMIFDAIDILKEPDNQEGYLIISASYYCLGESQFMQGNYLESLKYYGKSIEYNKPNDSASNLSVIYLGIGISYFYLHDLEKAEKFLKHSLLHYEQSIFVWRKATLYCYLSKVALNADNTELAKKYYFEAENVYNKYANKLEKDTILELKKELSDKKILIDDYT